MTLESKLKALYRPVDIASLVFFRIAYGAVMLWEVYRYTSNKWIEKYWIRPDFHFKYNFFHWVEPWPGDGMHVHFLVMGILAVLIMLGLFYRLAATLMFFAFTYIFLLEQARYLNHFYLVVTIAFLMIFLPVNRYFALDAKIWPKSRTETAPSWALWLMQFQIFVPYFFGGIAKCNSDWIQGEPMRDWLSSREDFPFIGKYFGDEWMVYFFSWSGLLIDLFIVPLLMIRRTRVAGFILIAAFHFTNTRLFDIGIFPWFMLAATTIFFPPDWPRRIIQDIWVTPNKRGTVGAFGFAVGVALATFFRQDTEFLTMSVGGIAGALTFWTLAERLTPGAEETWGQRARDIGNAPVQVPALGVVTASLLGFWVAFHCLFPLRHYVIPGNVHWTEEGHRFAWHMKLRDKDGKVLFTVTDPDTGQVQRIDPRERLKSWQYRKMATRPYMIRQYAHYLADEKREEGWPNPEVRVRAEVSLNGRPRQLLIDPLTDLSKQPFGYLHSDWVLDLNTPLKSE